MSASTAGATNARVRDAGFLRARLGSAVAIAPLGIWTLVHLYDNLAAFRGAEAWEAEVTRYAHPAAFFASAILALLPLGLHTVWGIARLFTSRPNLGRYRYYQNLKYVLQRLSAIGVLLFLGAHIYKAMLVPRLVHHRPETFADISEQMRNHTPTLVVYVLGVLGVAYHLADGVQTFAMGWGVVTSRVALRRMERFVLLFFLVMLAMGWSATYALWSAGA